MEVKKEFVNVIDADFIPFYVCHNKKDQPIKTLEDCIRLTDEFIDAINKATKADYYVGFLTVGKCFRYQVNPKYKSNRKYDNMPIYIKEIKDHMINKHGFSGLEGWEADDMVLSFEEQNNQHACYKVSPDKDILNLCGANFNPRKMEFKYTSIDEEREYFWKSMICGDTIDGIKGIPGKGEKYANKLFIRFLQCGERYHEVVLLAYIDHFGEYEGIKEFTRNYLSLKIVNNVILNAVKLNKVMSD